MENVEKTEKKDESKKDDKKRLQPLLTKKQKKAKKVIWYIGPKNRHNGQSLEINSFTTRWPGIVPDLHVFRKLKIEKNKFPHCHIY